MTSSLSTKDLYKSVNLGRSDSIRLLQLHGDHNDAHTEPIRCSLSQHSLSDEDLTYRCLSYVWGIKAEGNKIVVNDDFEVPVTKNLFEFLHRLRRGNSGGYLWIDAICIDQSNNSERNAQVAMMGSIYAHATQVIAWLGWEWDRLGDASDNGFNEYASTQYPEIVAQDLQARTLLEAEVAKNAAAEAGNLMEDDLGDVANSATSTEPLSDPTKKAATEDPTEVAIDFIKILVPAFQRWLDDGGCPWSGSLSRYGFDAPEMYLMLGIPRIRTKSWAALAHFLNRQWFQRAWIVQEAALAKKMLVVCGTRVLQWDEIVKTCIFLQASGWFHRLMKFIDPTGIMVGPGYVGVLFASLQKICNLETVNAELGEVVRSPLVLNPSDDRDLEYKLLLFFLQASRHFQASEKVDKVYAPLALLKQVRSTFAEKWGRQYTMQIQMLPDYDKSALKVYIDVAALILQHTPNLSLLSQVETRTAPLIENLPSWVPDFSKGNIAEFSGIPGLRYDALPGTVSDVAYSAAQDTIRLTGFVFDEIEALDPKFDLSFDTLFDNKDFRPWIKHCLEVGDSFTGVNGETYPESLWRTMIGDFYGNVQPAPKTSATSFKCYVQIMIATMLYKDVVDLSLQPYTEWHAWTCFDDLRAAVPQCTDAIPSVAELQEFAEHTRSVFIGEPPPSSTNRMRRKNENTAYSRLPELKTVSGPGYAYGLAVGRVYPMRRFIRTTNGYMGLAPLSAVAGDQIWFLSGGNVPFILRPATGDGTNCHRLIGECYLHGFMQGEILQQTGKSAFEMVTLR